MSRFAKTRFPRRLLVLLAGVLLIAGACQPVDPGDIGWEGPSFEGASGSPSGSKPQSKVWFNDGIWWADLWDSTSNEFYIHRLDPAAKRWIRTTTRLDDRSSSRSDSLWDGTHLYVASHSFAEGSSSTPTGQPAELRRFSYSPGPNSYTLDAGFPVVINDARTETLVIDEDSTGRIWATWVQDKRVMVTVSTVGGTSFAAPFELPVSGTSVSSDDISTVVAFGGNRMGVLWSNQSDDKMYFSSRLDAEGATEWDPTEVAYAGSASADDHINLKSVADQNGRILAAAKTSTSTPQVHLLDRDPTTATWSSHTFGVGSDNHTRPIVAVDDGAQLVHMFAASGESGGSIYEKTASLGNISFGPGKGKAVLTDDDNRDINNPTTTKQPVNSTTGLVVLATNDSTRKYWTHYDTLGGTATPTPPTASFAAGPTSGVAPLDVHFTDTSTGTPTSWSWNFGDGSTSTAQFPTHVYAAPGTYSVTLRASNSLGTDTEVRNGLVRVTTAPPGPLVFPTTADAKVRSDQATKNYGTSTELRTRGGSPASSAYLRFDVSGLAGAPAAARLRIFVTDGTRDPVTVDATSTSWTETGLTWQNAPPGDGAGLPSLAAPNSGVWVEVDVTAAVTGNGPVGLLLATTSTDSGVYASRETANPPQLLITP